MEPAERIQSLCLSLPPIETEVEYYDPEVRDLAPAAPAATLVLTVEPAAGADVADLIAVVTDHARTRAGVVLTRDPARESAGADGVTLAFVADGPADGLLQELAAVATEAAKHFRSGARLTAAVRPAA